MATDEWGIDDGWWGNDGIWHQANPESISAIRDAMAERGGPSAPRPPMWFVRVGSTPDLHGPCTIRTEVGDVVGAAGTLPHDLPMGVHELHPDDGGPTTTLVVSPGRTAGLGPRRWGVVAQLFSCRSTRSRGIGDFTDLVTIGRWLAGRGGQALGLNPLGAPLNLTPRHTSPYSPSSRRHLDPIYLDVDLLGAPSPTVVGSQRDDLIDRDRIWAEKLAALEGVYTATGPHEPDRRNLAYARFCALVEHHGCGWHRWPAELHDPTSPAVARAADSLGDRVSFWAWVDAQCDAQHGIARDALAGLGIRTIGDLTVGVDPDGYDAWTQQDVIAPGMSVGAPPDIFNPAGQDWSLGPLDPWALRAARYGPFVDTLGAMFERFDGLRIDHVMGLFRLYWIPMGAGPADGAYVRYPADELLDLVTLAAWRSGGIVVGEDLGTVEEHVRHNLADRRIAGTRVGWFDPHPESWPADTLGTLTTHDLPTVAGALSGEDATADPRLVAALLDTLAPEPDATANELLVAAHERLGAAGSDIVLATMEDVVGSTKRVNLPGADNGYPSWRTPLGVAVDELDEHPTARAVTDALRNARPG